MAKFFVTKRTYRDGKIYEPTGDPKDPAQFFFCEDEEIGKHCDSEALEPADEDTKEAILVFADESKAAKKLIDQREADKKVAEKKAKIDELKKKRTPPAAAAQDSGKS